MQSIDRSTMQALIDMINVCWNLKPEDALLMGFLKGEEIHYPTEDGSDTITAKGPIITIGEFPEIGAAFEVNADNGLKLYRMDESDLERWEVKYDNPIAWDDFLRMACELTDQSEEGEDFEQIHLPSKITEYEVWGTRQGISVLIALSDKYCHLGVMYGALVFDAPAVYRNSRRMTHPVQVSACRLVNLNASVEFTVRPGEEGFKYDPTFRDGSFIIPVHYDLREVAIVCQSFAFYTKEGTLITFGPRPE